MRTINDMVAEVSHGTRRVDGQVMVDHLYNAKCYWVGTNIIRVDLKPVVALAAERRAATWQPEVVITG